MEWIAVKKGMLIRVFSTVNRLEKELNFQQEAKERVVLLASACNTSTTSGEGGRYAPRQIVTAMRRTANHLQFDLAANNWVGAVRQLQLFYGLHNLLREPPMPSERVYH